MDYEKKYKEALEWARKIMQGKVGFVFDEVLEKFPELKESEEERIKNAAIRACKYMIDNFENSTKDYEDAIAWLEKQGEKKPVPDWMPKFLDELRSKKNYFDWEEHKDIEGGILAIINWMNPNYFNGKDGEQKPAAWSEEDEKHIHSIISTIEYCKRENATAPFIVQHYNADLDWLKSLKDKVGREVNCTTTKEYYEEVLKRFKDFK